MRKRVPLHYQTCDDLVQCLQVIRAKIAKRPEPVLYRAEAVIVSKLQANCGVRGAVDKLSNKSYVKSQSKGGMTKDESR